MADLFWPGDDRAGDHLTSQTFLEAMVAVEAIWLDVLVEHGLAPEAARDDLHAMVEPDHLDRLAAESERSANPVVALVALLRAGVDRRDNQEAARWLHRGLTSQDVLDTALVLMAQDAVGEVRAQLREQVARLAELAAEHRDTPMVARTLTQHAVPTTFGLKVAGWLSGLLDAYDALAALDFPLQLGGAAGTHAALVELGGDPVAIAADVASRLGLVARAPWHTARSPLTRIGDAAVTCTDAWGRIARDVLELGRPEVGELAEGTGGGSSTMPDKVNPVLSLQVRRAALAAPPLAATLHLAAADQVDERPDGGWHSEWATLRTLLRRTVVAGSQAVDLLAGLRVRPDRMRTTLEAAQPGVLAEQRTMAELAGHEPTGDYLGAAGPLVDAALDRARTHLEDRP